MRETGYVGDTRGPEQDTESYYKRTPMPGSRSLEWREAPEGPKDHAHAQESGWISRDVLSRGSADAGRSTIPWVPILLATGLVALVSIIAAGIVLLLSWDPSDPPPPVPAVEEEPDDWQGLRVKKGLR